jgi:hypothetical protein
MHEASNKPRDAIACTYAGAYAHVGGCAFELASRVKLLRGGRSAAAGRRVMP